MGRANGEWRGRAMADDQDSETAKRQQEERDRRAANIFLLVGAVIFIGIGIWLANAMIDARRADECLSSGRRNCAPLDVPAR
jgi:cytoskeletal protein RodZ